MDMREMWKQANTELYDYEYLKRAHFYSQYKYCYVHDEHSILSWANISLLQNNIAEVPGLRKHLITNEFIDLIG